MTPQLAAGVGGESEAASCMAPATAARSWWLRAGSEPRGQNSPSALGFPIRWLEVSRQIFG